MEFKNILFDFGGVIQELNIERCVQNFVRLGLPSNFFEGRFWDVEILKRMDRGTATEDEFYDEMRRIGNIPEATNEEILEAWNSLLSGIKEPVVSALRELKKRYPLYILSNSNIMHWRICHEKLMWFEGEDIFKWFRQSFASFEMHLEKPEPAIFERVIQQTGIKAEETLFIDDLAENLEGAAAVGFQTLLTKNGDWIKVLTGKS